MQIVDFWWWRCLDGYRLDRSQNKRWLPYSNRYVSEPPARLFFGLTSASERFEKYQPLNIQNLFAMFADAPSSPDGMKDFCDRFGDPDGGRADLAPLGKPTQTSVSVDRLLQLQRRLRRALSLFRKGDASGLIGCWNSSDESALIRTELRAGSETAAWSWSSLRPTLFRRCGFSSLSSPAREPSSLAASAATTPFTVGSGTGRRSTSKYCSNACKVAAFKERHAQTEEEPNERPHSREVAGPLGHRSRRAAIPRRASANASGTRSSEPSAKRRPSARVSSPSSRKALTLSRPRRRSRCSSTNGWSRSSRMSRRAPMSAIGRLRERTSFRCSAKSL